MKGIAQTMKSPTYNYHPPLGDLQTPPQQHTDPRTTATPTATPQQLHLQAHPNSNSAANTNSDALTSPNDPTQRQQQPQTQLPRNPQTHNLPQDQHSHQHPTAYLTIT
jgi:hypothetical protein